MEKRSQTLYNILLPIWLLWIFPQVWLIILPGNLVIDLLVLLLALAVLRHSGKGAVVKALWWKLWLLGFAADAVGVGWMVLGMFTAASGQGWWAENLTPITGSPFRTPLALAWTLVGVAIAGACIYFFDKRAMKGCPLLTPRERHVTALLLAILTAPWLFLVPMY